MTPSAQIAGGRRVRRWSRDTIVEKIRQWNDRYGEPPCSADWNPSLARWRAQEWRAERYREGSWPSTNAAKRPFGGSFDAAVRAAGLEPHRPGPRRRAAGVARPDFPQREPQGPRGVDDARVRDLERRLRAAERRAQRAELAARDARRRARRASEREGRARRARDRVELSQRTARELTAERVEQLVADGEARVRAAVDQAEAATREVTDARRSQQRAATRAADAEARAEAAERLAAAARADAAERLAAAARADAAERLAAAARADAAERLAAAARTEAAERHDAASSGGAAERRGPASSGDAAERRGPASSGDGAERRGPASSGDGAERRCAELARPVTNGNGAAWKAARAAEDRAAAAERRARELAVLVCGEARQLTAAELAALRDGGASGPAVLAAALREVGRARASGNGPALDAALTAIASAAVRWRDRL